MKYCSAPPYLGVPMFPRGVVVHPVKARLAEKVHLGAVHLSVVASHLSLAAFQHSTVLLPFHPTSSCYRYFHRLERAELRAH